MQQLPPNPIITLLTDFGHEDVFVGLMKGVILGINRQARIVDLTHNLRPQNIRQASFLTVKSYSHFPAGTIHLVIVDPGVGGKRRSLLLHQNEHFFIGPDNGVFSELLAEQEGLPVRRNCVSLTDNRYFRSTIAPTFHGRDVFASVAGHLSRGASMSDFGQAVDDPVQLPEMKVYIDDETIRGQVVHIDRFGNLITNITSSLLRQFRGFQECIFQIGDCLINQLSRTYIEVQIGQPVAYLGSFNTLEIGVRNGDAAREMNIDLDTEIRVSLRAIDTEKDM